LGDIAADRGTAAEYACATAYFAQFRAPRVFITGNHDYLYLDEPGRTAATPKATPPPAAKLQRFQKTFNLPALYRSQKSAATCSYSCPPIRSTPPIWRSYPPISSSGCGRN
jgi:hypothetical protein